MHSTTRRLLLPLLVGGVLVWSTALAAAPYALSQRTAGGTLVATVVYVTGSFICHQRAERSFHPWGVKFPVCGRCAGLYAGALLGLMGAARCLRAQATRARIAAAALPTGATLVLEVLGIVDPGNLGRAAAAVPLGAAVCWFMAGVIRGKVH